MPWFRKGAAFFQRHLPILVKRIGFLISMIRFSPFFLLKNCITKVIYTKNFYKIILVLIGFFFPLITISEAETSLFRQVVDDIPNTPNLDYLHNALITAGDNFFVVDALRGDMATFTCSHRDTLSHYLEAIHSSNIR